MISKQQRELAHLRAKVAAYEERDSYLKGLMQQADVAIATLATKNRDLEALLLGAKQDLAEQTARHEAICETWREQGASQADALAQQTAVIREWEKRFDTLLKILAK